MLSGPRPARGGDRRRRDAVARARGRGRRDRGPAPAGGLAVPGRGGRWACSRCPRLQAPRHPLTRVPVEKSPATLEDRARELMSRLGRREAGRLTRWASRYDADYLRWTPGARPLADALGLARHRRPAARAVLVPPEPAAARRARTSAGASTWNDPSRRAPAWRAPATTSRGRLLSLLRRAAPARASEHGRRPRRRRAGGGEPDWAPLFARPGSTRRASQRVEPRWTPPFYVDARAAWEGHWPVAARAGAAHRGRELSRPAGLVRDQEPLDAAGAGAGSSA